MKREDEMNEPTLEQFRDWQRRLAQLVGEMETAFGEPGQDNQDLLDSAVHIAFHLASEKVELAQRVNRVEVPDGR